MHCLGQGLNCVFISDIQMTATKVMGFYMESSAKHKTSLRKVSVGIVDIFQVLLPLSSYPFCPVRCLSTRLCEVYH